MRIAGALLLSVFLLTGTYYYTSFADSIRREPIVFKAKMDSGQWRVEVYRTFDCVPDPDSNTAALQIQLKGASILERNDPVPATDLVEVTDIQGIEQGTNELFFDANLATLDDFEFAANASPAAMKVVVLRGDSRIAEQSFWLPSGESSIRESVQFEAPIDNRNTDNGGSEHGS